MNRSVEPAFTLRKKQLEQEKLAMQIADLERSIARPADEGIRRYSAFEFFKGFLKASVIVTAVLAVPSYIYCGISNFLYKSGNPDCANPEIKAVLFLAGIFALLHLIGGFVARKRRDAYNNSVDNTIAANLKRKESLKKELEDLKERYNNNLMDLESCDDNVPNI